MSGMGVVEQILISPDKGAQMKIVPEVEARQGQGLVGDRYFLARNRQGPGAQVTMIELEKIEGFQKTSGLLFDAQDARRNIVTRGIELNPLVDREFYLGSILVRGVLLCEPCELLAKRTYRDVSWGLVHQGGLRCQILSSGTLRVGDAVVPR